MKEEKQRMNARGRFVISSFIKYLMKIGLYRKFFDNCIDYAYLNKPETSDWYYVRYDQVKTYREAFELYRNTIMNRVGGWSGDAVYDMIQVRYCFEYVKYGFSTKLEEPLMVRDKEIYGMLPYIMLWEEDLQGFIDKKEEYLFERFKNYF